MGEYIGIAADAGRFYYLWGDNRNTVTNVELAGRPASTRTSSSSAR